MFGLHSNNTQRNCGVVVDIGSGSVGIAIVISDAKKNEPEIIWSHREYVLIKDIENTEVPLKEITTSLINAFLQLGSTGLKTLHGHAQKKPISSVHVTISAPWTYTVTKTINFTDEHPFEVNQELIEDLSNTAEKQAVEAVLENKIFEENQLEIIDNATVSTTINGYLVENPRKIKTRAVSLAHITAITQRKLVHTLNDSIHKILPDVNITTHSFMYTFYNVLKHMKPNSHEACLVDVTSEATEIGIIREGTLTHVTHTAFGTFSIAREIASVCNIPKEEAYSYLKGGTNFLEAKLSKAKQLELDAVLESYENKIADLLKRTGDSLSIPKTIFLHSEASTSAFFLKHIAASAKKATTMQHSIHPITTLLFSEIKDSNTSLLLSAHHLHRIHTEKYKSLS